MLVEGEQLPPLTYKCSPAPPSSASSTPSSGSLPGLCTCPAFPSSTVIVVITANPEGAGTVPCRSESLSEKGRWGCRRGPRPCSHPGFTLRIQLPLETEPCPPPPMLRSLPASQRGVLPAVCSLPPPIYPSASTPLLLEGTEDPGNLHAQQHTRPLGCPPPWSEPPHLSLGSLHRPSKEPPSATPTHRTVPPPRSRQREPWEVAPTVAAAWGMRRASHSQEKPKSFGGVCQALPD